MPYLRSQKSVVSSQTPESLNSESVAVLKSKNLQRGFTLVEVLITIAIIGIISVVAIPNLNRFNQSQNLTNATSDLKNLIRKAEVNAQSGIVCSNSQPATGWDIVKHDPSTIDLGCRIAGDWETPTTYYSPTPSSLSQDSINFTFLCSNGDLPTKEAIFFDSITYNSNAISIGGCPSVLDITLSKDSTTSKVSVTSGGAIYESI